MFRLPAILIALVFCAPGQETYRKPPKEILDVLNAPPTPQLAVSPVRDAALVFEPLAYHSIADIAQPMLRIAGLRINVATNGPHPAYYFTGLSVMKLPGGEVTKVVLPAGFKGASPAWSADGKMFAFARIAPTGYELWVGDAATAKARRLGTMLLNAAIGDELTWMPDNRTLLVQAIPAARGKAPAPPAAPAGPNIQESSGKGAAVWTFQDLLKNPHDEALFDYYATSQLLLVNAATGTATPLGKPAIVTSANPAPDGKHIMVTTVHRPYSYLYPHSYFPREVEVWDRAGKLAHKLASLPLQDAVPTDGVPIGPRNHNWRATEPATVYWVEALDKGDPKNKVPHRDRVMMLKAPFTGEPLEVIKTEQRFAGMGFLDKDPLAIVSDYERERRWIRSFLIKPDAPGEAPRLLWSRDTRDRYKDPGQPVFRTLPTGHRAILQTGDGILLQGSGASPQGDRPFLDRASLATLQTERLFQADASAYEMVTAVLKPDGSQILTRRESPSDPPNYYVRTGGSAQAITKWLDPAPVLRQIKKQLVKYKRGDGVDLSFTLYLPPGYKEGTRLPTVVWAYPLEYSDPATAGQVFGSPQRFTMIRGSSHLFYLLRGYAVLDDATMPVVGDFKTVNDTYIDQVVASAKAAIDKAVEMGVADPNRVGVGGHSYGAFMTANLLAHCDLFRAGVARSGAYNRTLTPFGFQSERRTFWEAPETYFKMSPFMHAQKINEPILFIHGEADNNSGTFPIQSERMYQAVRGNGGTVRYVTLPHESHGYMARESIEHVLWEMMSWFDRHVKDAPPRAAGAR